MPFRSFHIYQGNKRAVVNKIPYGEMKKTADKNCLHRINKIYGKH